MMKLVLSVALVATLVGGGAAWADPTGAPQAVFYEVTENMKVVNRRVQHRVATSALSGGGVIGTPFCPTALVQSYDPNAVTCDLTAIGSDDVDVVTGLGTFKATIAVVIQGDNPVDGPEFVIDRIKVRGKMDFSPALVGIPPYGPLPFGTVTGRVTFHDDVETEGHPKFIGVFRLPFLIPAGARPFVCPATVDPNPNFPGHDIAYIDTDSLGTLTGKCIDITPAELSLGVPTVRFEIWFL